MVKRPGLQPPPPPQPIVVKVPAAKIPTPAPAAPPALRPLQEGPARIIPLASLRAGDRLTLKTENSTYTVQVGRDSQGMLSSSNKKAKIGYVSLRGGINEEGSEYTPESFRVGYRFVYSLSDDTPAIITSVITEISVEPSSPIPVSRPANLRILE